MCDDSQARIVDLKDTVRALEVAIMQLQETITCLKGDISTSKFCIENVCKHYQDVMFYTEFPCLAD